MNKFFIKALSRPAIPPTRCCLRAFGRLPIWVIRYTVGSPYQRPYCADANQSGSSVSESLWWRRVRLALGSFTRLSSSCLSFETKLPFSLSLSLASLERVASFFLRGLENLIVLSFGNSWLVASLLMIYLFFFARISKMRLACFGLTQSIAPGVCRLGIATFSY